MKNYLILSVFALIVLVSACNSNDKSDMTANVENTAIQKENMNTSIQPGDDFFRYANGGWMAANPIPEEYSRFGAFEVLDKMNKDRIKSLIEEVSQQENAEKGSPAQQIRDFYNAAMDTAKINNLGFTPILPVLDEINAMESIADVPAMVANLNMKGIFSVHIVYAGQDDKNSERVIANGLQGGLSLPDRDYYTNDDPRTLEIRGEYVNYI
jgi:putative endopeptidase